MIYFITCADANAVKIGHTSGRPFERLNQTQVHCPFDLELTAVCEGGMVEEAVLHTRFANLRIRGEWFKLSDRLRAHIATLPKPERVARGWHGQVRNRQAA